MKLNKKLASVGLGCALALAGSHADAQIVLSQWNFENYTIPATATADNSPTPSMGSGTASSIGMNVYPTPNVGVTFDDITQGATSDTGTNSVADLTQIWRIRGQAGSNGAANGWSSAAPIATQGAQFFVPTTGAVGPITVGFDWYSTNAGEAKLALEYTTNGTSWSDLTINPGTSGLTISTNSSSANTILGSYANGGTAGQEWFKGLTATINDPLAANDPNFAIELVNASTGADDTNIKGTALNNNSGNWRFDNVTISAAAAAPEPGSWSMALIVAGAFLMLRRRAISKA